MKYCKKCDTDKDFSEFSTSKQTKDGLLCYCKSCQKIAQKKWRDSNKEKRKDYAKDYGPKRYKENKEIKDKKSRQWIKDNPDSTAQYFQTYVNKPGIRDKRNKKTREWRLNNMDKDRIKCAKRRAKINGAYDDGSITVESINIMYDNQKGLCNICECDISKGYEKDHIIPLSKNGPHIITNIQLLCKLCNGRKWNKILVNNKL